MGTKCQRSDLERLKTGLLVLATNPNSAEYKELLKSATKLFQQGLAEGKDINGAIAHSLYTVAFDNRHKLKHALQAASIRPQIQNRQQYCGAIFAGSRIVQGPKTIL